MEFCPGKGVLKREVSKHQDINNTSENIGEMEEVKEE